MNAISKRLLSWLCVIAMVLSFVPVMNLSNFAVTTKAAEEIVYGSANLADVDAAILEQMNKGNAIDNSDDAINAHIKAGTCPMCGATGITWAKKTAGVNLNADGSKEDIATRDGDTLHVYYDTAFDLAGNLVQMVNLNKGVCQNNTICMALKSTADITCTKYRIQIGGTNNTLNIMGTGKITADQSKSEWNQGDLGLFQNTSGIVNLYGGEFKHVHKGEDFKKAVLRVDGASAVFNIYAGAKIGPETQDTTKVAMNVQYANGGTVNMFGGEIRNGVSPAWGYSGNVTITTKDSSAKAGTFNMYGGKIYGGSFLDAEAVTSGVTNNANIGGNVMVGGKSQAAYYKEDGSDDYTCYAGTFNMYGGTISGGKANNGGNGGGNINIYHSSASATILGGTIENGYAKKYGGNIQSCGGDITIGGTALISGGESVSHGGNIFVDHTSCALTINGGKLVGGTTTNADANGGSVYVNKCQSLSISNAIFDGGHSGCHGGNLFIGSNAADKVATISNVIFQNGLAEAQGGNISTAVSVTMENCTVADGTGRKGGGNINVSSQSKVLTLKDCTLYGGWVSGAKGTDGKLTAPTGAQWGGNIRTWGSDVVIDGGLYHSGYRGVNKETAYQGNNIACLASLEKTSTSNVNEPTLTIGGDAIIVGDVNTSGPSKNTPAEGAAQLTCAGTSIVLKDAPQIVSSYALADGTVVKASTGGLLIPSNSNGSIKADISGLSAEAKICVNGVALNRVISIADANAANVAKCFSVYGNDELVALANDANQLVISEKPYEAPVKPEAALGGQNVSDEVWAEVQKADLIQLKASEFELDANSQAECPVCGEVVTWTEATYPKQLAVENGKYHFYLDADTEVNPQYNWAALNAKNMTMCFMLLNGNTAKEIKGLMGVRGKAVGCTLNIMGDGIITSDGTKTNDGQFGVISMQGNTNTVNLYGGTFIYTGDGEGRAYDDLNGNDKYDKETETYYPDGVAYAAALSIKGYSNTLNMFEGVVIGPETQDLTKVMYNVRIEPQLKDGVNTFNMYGGIIRNGVTNDKKTSGNVTTVYNSAKYTGTKPTFNMYGGSIENGSYMQGEGITPVTATGGNVYAAAGTQLNVYGGVISGGKVNGNGGNIVAIDSSNSNINLNGGTISGGEAKNGGNIYATANVTLNQYALVENGHATGNGGNLYITGGNGDAVQNAGSEVRNGTCAGTGGGNVFVNTSGTYDMKGGKIYGGKANADGGNGGNILAQGGYSKTEKVFTDAYFNMSGNAEVYNGYAENQGGNMRGYIATVTMTDNAKIYGGTGDGGCDQLWLVDGILTMSGKASVIGDGNGEAINATVYRRDNTITLAGNACVMSEDGDPDGEMKIFTGTHADDKVTALSVTLQISNDWTGTAYADFRATYKVGETLPANVAICGSVVDSVFTAGGSYTGKLLYDDAQDAGIIGVDGALVVASGAVVDANGVETWYAGNDAALAAYDKATDAYVVLTPDAEGEVEITKDAVISTNGQDLVLKNTGDTTVNVSLIDPANKDFKSVSEVTVSGAVELETNDVTVNGERYITLENGNVWSAHYVEMVLTSVSLRNTDEPGLYYKASYKCDAQLRDRIYGYGVALKANAAPTADEFNSESATEWTAYDSDDFKALYGDNEQYAVATISGALTGILKEESATRTAAQNEAYVLVPVYAAPYLIVNYDGNGKGIETYLLGEARGLSFDDVLGMIDDNFDKYSVTQKNIITSFVGKWGAYLGDFENF